MSFSPIPDLCVPDIFALTPEELHRRGITLLLMDLDNTLSPYGEAEPSAQVLAWLKALKASGIDLFLVSNSRKSERAGIWAKAARVPYIRRAKKPSPQGPLKAMGRMEKTPEETALVGDQIFTDVLAANRAGILSIAVTPIDMDNPFRYIRYLIEQPFRLMCKEKCK